MAKTQLRSRDSHLESGPDTMMTSPGQRSRPQLTKANLGIATVLLLSIAFVLLTRNHWEVSSIPLLGSINLQNQLQSSKASSDGIPPTPEQHAGSFQLHPEQHAYRQSTTLEATWRVTKCERRPDGVLKSVYCINDGEIPGPTLEARSGDRLMIEVENAMEDEGLSFHWHGLSMRGFNDMDGAVGITQAPIKPGAKFTYNFTIETHGTFWYHAHDGVQRGDGLYGGLIVHEPVENHEDIKPDSEYLMMIGDWYHRSAKDALEFYSHEGAFGNEPVPDSLLVNGASAYHCSDAVPARPVDCVTREMTSLPTLRLDSGKRNVVRLVNCGSYAGMSLSIPGASITPIRVDGGNLVSSTGATSVGVLHPGERVDLLIEPSVSMNDDDRNLEVIMDDNPFKYPNPALTMRHNFPFAWTGTGISGSSSKPAAERVDLQTLNRCSDLTSHPPATADQTMVFYAKTDKLAHLNNKPLGFINRTSWYPQETPLMELDRDQWDQNQFVPQISHAGSSAQWIDVVLNNLDEEGHPFHLHGYDFYVLSTFSSTYNWGSYNPFEGAQPPGGPFNIETSVKKDTIYIPRRGYAVLRVHMDNPGVWMFHCHNLWHQQTGMAMAFEVE